MGGWADFELGVKWRWSEQNRTVYAKSTVKKWKMETSSLETGADSGLQGMMEEYIMDESSFAASSSLSEEERTAMSKLVKALALSCFIHNVDF